MCIEELLVRVVAPERRRGQCLGLVEADMELLYCARRCVLCRGGGHEELRQERESLFVQWLSCAEEGLHCGHQSSAGDVSDRPEVTPTVPVGLSLKLQFAAMPYVQIADIFTHECPRGSR